MTSQYGKIPRESFHHPTMGCEGCVRFKTCEADARGQAIRCDHARIMPEEVQ